MKRPVRTARVFSKANQAGRSVPPEPRSAPRGGSAGTLRPACHGWNRNRILAGTLVLTAVSNCLTGFAQAGESSSEPLSLERCIDKALGRSVDLELARLDIRAAEQAILQARAALLPHLDTRLSSGYLSGSSVTGLALLGGFEDTTELVDTSLGVKRGRDVSGPVWVSRTMLRYPIFEDGSIMGLNDAPAVASARAQKTALEWVRHLTREEVILAVTEAYLMAASSATQLALNEKKLHLLERRCAIVNEEKNLGMKIESEAEMDNSRLRGHEEALAISRVQAETARLRLAELVNPTTGEPVRIDTGLPSAPKLPDLPGLVETTLQGHPAFGAQRAAVERSAQEYRIARSRKYPAVSLKSDLIYGDDFSPPRRNLYTAYINFEIPLFDFGEREAAKEASRSKHESEQLRMRKVAEDLKTALIDLYGALHVIGQKVKTRNEVLAESATALEVARARHKAGAEAPLVVVDAEVDFLDKQLLLNEERLRELALYAALQNVMGGTWRWTHGGQEASAP